jgi:hypothetical protein
MRVFIVQAYQASQYVVPRGGIFLGKWRSSFAGNSDGKMNVKSACVLNIRYNSILKYCDGFAQGIFGRRPGGHILAHAPRGSTVEVFPSCPRMDRCYKTHAR